MFNKPFHPSNINPKPLSRLFRLLLPIPLIILMLISFAPQAFAYTDTEIVNAIYKSEGGSKATYLYGIRSVKYDTPTEARQICLNTIRNQRKRHKAHICNLSFIECLAQRYCPIGASNDPKGLNVNWLSNVRYFLERSAP